MGLKGPNESTWSTLISAWHMVTIIYEHIYAYIIYSIIYAYIFKVLDLLMRVKHALSIQINCLDIKYSSDSYLVFHKCNGRQRE